MASEKPVGADTVPKDPEDTQLFSIDDWDEVDDSVEIKSAAKVCSFGKRFPFLSHIHIGSSRLGWRVKIAIYLPIRRLQRYYSSSPQ